MPTAAPKPCLQPGCGVLARDGTSRCPAHKLKAWVSRPDIAPRVTGRRLQKMRAALFAREPLCRECARHGHVALATIRDHIKPWADGGTDDDSNIQPLCQRCSDEKTARESVQGRGVQMSAPPQAETVPQVKFSCAQVSGNFSGMGK